MRKAIVFRDGWTFQVRCCCFYSIRNCIHCEVKWHVAPELSKDKIRQLVGNCLGVIIFNDSGMSFLLSWIHSHFQMILLNQRNCFWDKSRLLSSLFSLMLSWWDLLEKQRQDIGTFFNSIALLDFRCLHVVSASIWTTKRSTTWIWFPRRRHALIQKRRFKMFLLARPSPRILRSTPQQSQILFWHYVCLIWLFLFISSHWIVYNGIHSASVHHDLVRRQFRVPFAYELQTFGETFAASWLSKTQGKSKKWYRLAVLIIYIYMKWHFVMILYYLDEQGTRKETRRYSSFIRWIYLVFAIEYV